jgi:hypothetical protein
MFRMNSFGCAEKNSFSSAPATCIGAKFFEGFLFEIGFTS